MSERKYRYRMVYPAPTSIVGNGPKVAPGDEVRLTVDQAKALGNKVKKIGRKTDTADE